MKHSLGLASLGILLCLLTLTPLAFAENEETKQEEEEDDGGNFLAIPLIITEPAIGEGLGAAFIYFHDTPDDKPRAASGRSLAKTGRKQNPPPTASAIGGFYTNDDTYAVGIGHARPSGKTPGE